MVTFAAVLTSVLLAALAIFQLSLTLGAPLGRFAWGGQHRVLPVTLRVGSCVSIVIYALIAAVVTTRAGLTSADPTHTAIGVAAWVVTIYFVLGIGLNLASRSKPERIVMTPICAVLAALCGVVALS